MTVDVVPAAVYPSFWVFFLQADPVVKGVMILLLVASIVCWAIILDKSVRLFRARAAARRLSVAVIAGQPHPETVGGFEDDIVASGIRASRDAESDESRKDRRDRIERVMRATMLGELKRLEAGLLFLATVGSTAPFVGLFGTVWGIMNSFTAIAASKDTSLAVVAPGIAEALSATALGLVAAIPAVVAYNKFSAGLSGIAHEVGLAIADLGDQLSRRSHSDFGAQAGKVTEKRGGSI